LLAAVAQRLSACVRASDTLARLGGDEFTVLVERVSDLRDVEPLATRILESFRAPFTLDGHTVFTSTSIGIAMSGPATGPEDLLRQADIALYAAKSQGPASFRAFEAARHVPSLERLNLETDLRNAIERGELRVYYQPQVNARTGEITGFEALVRWLHPERGLLGPGEFLPLAEEAGMISDIDQWVLNEACQQASVWRARYAERLPMRMGVNFSPTEFHQIDLLRVVSQALDRTGLEPNALTIEITENVLLDDAPSTIYLLRALHDLGVRLAIDDFGIGYSSLSYLRRFAVDALKIDQSFVRDLSSEGPGTSIVRAITTLAHALDIEVTAEGVETPEHLALIQAAGCDHGQGYYFARPVPAEEAEMLLRAGHIPHPSVIAPT
jgi:predicted signal transduction protein with EAL and GGDEF domain